MPSLGDLIGALISQIGNGRSQADIATLEVGKLYKDHPLLSGFPVPRLTLDEVVVDLKIAIGAAPTPSRFITSKVKENVLALLREIVNNIEKEPSLINMSREFPELQKVWKSTHRQIDQRMSEFIPVDVEIDIKSTSYGVASIIRGYLTNTVLSVEAKVPLEKARNFLNVDTPQIEIRLVSQIQEGISKLLEIHPPLKDRFDVLVTASDLQVIPPEKLTTLKLTLHESDRVWTQIETEKGEIKDKLVPD